LGFIELQSRFVAMDSTYYIDWQYSDT